MTAFIDQWRELLQPTTMGQVPAPGGILIASGPDALDFLHRMSTHAVEGGQPRSQAGVLNCFVDKRGRIVDVVHMRVDHDERATLVCERSAESLKAFLEGFLFMEDAELVVIDAPLVRVVGAGAVAALSSEGTSTTPAQPSQFLSEHAVRGFDYAGPSAEPIPTVLATPSALDAAGVSPLALSTEVAEAARIAAGAPAAPGELSDAHNPLELDLHDAIDWKKGCYIGQEVISRIDNYGKQAKRLVSICVDAAQLSTEWRIETPVFDGDKKIGALTSVTSPACRSVDAPVALALLKVPPLEKRHAVTLGDERRAAFATTRMAAQAPHD